MPLFEMSQNAFRPVAGASFAALRLSERGDIQRLLRTQIEVLDEDLLVLAEEFSDWDESSRRIDLLALDREANLVVIELKRTADGGHMELQALRYAAMVSAMTFDRAERIHAQFLAATGGDPSTARDALLEFLGWDAPEEESFAQKTRILLVSEDFGKELTTTVLWLRGFDLDIRCVRLRPYQHNGSVLVDVQQVIPLPEAQDYQIQLREKEKAERKTNRERYEERFRLWELVIAEARARNTRHSRVEPNKRRYLGTSSGVPGLEFNFIATMHNCAVNLYIKRREAGANKAIFDQLIARREDIEKRFGGALQWERMDGRLACRVEHTIETGGYRSPPEVLDRLPSEMVDAMERLEKALGPALQDLGI